MVFIKTRRKKCDEKHLILVVLTKGFVNFLSYVRSFWLQNYLLFKLCTFDLFRRLRERKWWVHQRNFLIRYGRSACSSVKFLKAIISLSFFCRKTIKWVHIALWDVKLRYQALACGALSSKAFSRWREACSFEIQRSRWTFPS